MELRPKIKDYPRDNYNAIKHLSDLISWAELAEDEIEKLREKNIELKKLRS